MLEFGWFHGVDLSLLDLDNARLALRLAVLRSGRITNERGLVILSSLYVLWLLCGCLPLN